MTIGIEVSRVWVMARSASEQSEFILDGLTASFLVESAIEESRFQTMVFQLSKPDGNEVWE